MTVSGRLAVPALRFSMGISWPLLVAAGAFLSLLTQPGLLLGDGDVYWHVAAGRWIIEHTAIPTADPFSYPLRDAPWTAHEWLAEVMFASAYAAGGWSAVLAVAAGAYAWSLALLTRFLLRHLEPIYALLFATMSASLLAPHLTARPHALMAPLLVTWVVGLVRARERSVAPPWPLAFVMVLWANLHGSFLLALGLVVAFATEAIVASAPGAPRRSSARAWGLFLALSAMAAMATPFGARGVLFAIELDRMTYALSVIGEWRSLNFQRLQPLELWLLIFGGAILLRGLKLPPVRIILLLGLLHLALKHARHADLLALIAPVIVAEPIAAQWSVSGNKADQAARLDRWFAALAPPAAKGSVALVLVLLLAVSAAAIRRDAVRPSDDITPHAALRAAQDAGIRGPVLNEWNYGGYLIFSGIPPFIDGRADLYGDAFIQTYAEAMTLSKPELLPQLLEKYRVHWTLLSLDTPAVRALDRLPGWRRFYADKTAVVHVRECALPDGQRNAL
ncbi:MAG: hypothetical protein EPO27_21090, partial [Betaproteobacteria bacterium]